MNLAQADIDKGSQENEGVEAGRITVREGVHVPGEGVPLIKDVTYDMARGDVKTVGQDTMFQASCCA